MASAGSKSLIGSLKFRGVTGLNTYLQQGYDPNLRSHYREDLTFIVLVSREVSAHPPQPQPHDSAADPARRLLAVDPVAGCHGS
jgi:hypothetical protein